MSYGAVPCAVPLLQVPGLSMAADETETLRRGYWPSYNVPYFPEIYKCGNLPSSLDTETLCMHASMLLCAAWLARPSYCQRRAQGWCAVQSISMPVMYLAQH